METCTVPELRLQGRLPIHVDKFPHVRVLEVLERKGHFGVLNERPRVKCLPQTARSWICRISVRRVVLYQLQPTEGQSHGRESFRLDAHVHSTIRPSIGRVAAIVVHLRG